MYSTPRAGYLFPPAQRGREKERGGWGERESERERRAREKGGGGGCGFVPCGVFLDPRGRETHLPRKGERAEKKEAAKQIHDPFPFSSKALSGLPPAEDAGRAQRRLEYLAGGRGGGG